MSGARNKAPKVLVEATGLAPAVASAPRIAQRDAGGQDPVDPVPPTERLHPMHAGVHVGAQVGASVGKGAPTSAGVAGAGRNVSNPYAGADQRVTIRPIQARSPGRGPTDTYRGDGDGEADYLMAPSTSDAAHSGATGCTHDATTGRGFRPDQVRALKCRLKAAHIKERRIGDRVLPYVEGWHVIAEANRIFGHHGWHRQTLSCQVVHASQSRDGYRVVYIAQVRITADAGGKPVIREGIGTGEACESEPGTAHERAAKGAETDAMKRALMTFGQPFGLGLYTGMVTRKRGGR